MDNVHWLIRTQGTEEARRQAVTKRERQIVEAAYQVLSEEEERIGFSYSGFALTSLPPSRSTSSHGDGKVII